jgi:hypothetical protein
MWPWLYTPFKAEKWVAKIQSTLKFYQIKYKDVNGKNFWNVKKKVLNVIQESKYSKASHAKFDDILHMFA